MALTEYVNTKQQYRLLVPAGWDVKGKAGEQPAWNKTGCRSPWVRRGWRRTGMGPGGPCARLGVK